MKAHPTALVDSRAKLSEDVEVGPYSVVGPGVTIGPGSVIMNHVTLIGRTTLGSNNTVYPYAVLGGKPQDLKYRGEDTQVVIGDGNTFREFVTVNIGTAGGGGVTKIGNGGLYMAGCHVAHDCELGDHVVIANNVLLAGHVRIEDYVGMSAYVGLHHFVTVGRHAFVGGFSRISVDVPPFMVVSGVPLSVVSTNAVGLRRRGIQDSTLLALREAHRLIWRSGLPRPEAMAQIEKRYPNDQEIRYLIEFMRAIDRGKNGRAREALRGAGGFPDPDDEPVKAPEAAS
ncbi:MAG TPA: acyl-ACP--UDP-N-acetylglucosamine O-acyltransferase [Planctomycetota bacterium]|nr:acyl-ACP--UDP-N-acetylglucosamine O-acyltransferase [Planctomycetota bacterium]